jgi:hypothetical protein
VQDALNGQDVVRFDGTDDFLTGGDILDDVFVGADQQFTLLTVVHTTAGDNDSSGSSGRRNGDRWNGEGAD